MSVVDTAAARVATLALKASAAPRIAGPLDVDRHHALAREAAGRSMVLLKNDGALLPLAKDQNIAVIGVFAKEPRFQGAGSSLINPTRLDIAVDQIGAAASGHVSYSPGFRLDADTPRSKRRG